MMDELELLKKDWQRKEKQLPKLSYDDIYKMLWKKSSSIVKWIFYISVAEFIFWIAIGLIPIQTEELTGNGVQLFERIEFFLEVVSYLVIVFFMFKFYQNYKKISAADSARGLMQKIIITRKTVMYYVWFNLGLFSVMAVVVFFETLLFGENQDLIDKVAAADYTIALWFLVGFLVLAGIAFFALLLWLFYRLLYGILLKRLNNNYRELKKLEV